MPPHPHQRSQQRSLNGYRLDDQPLVRNETEAAAVRASNAACISSGEAKLTVSGRVDAVIAQLRRRHVAIRSGATSCAASARRASAANISAVSRKLASRRRAKIYRLLAHQPQLGEPDTIGDSTPASG